MSLEDYKVAHDRFKPVDGRFNSEMAFPCCCCAYSAKGVYSEPCCRCGHAGNDDPEKWPMEAAIARVRGMP